MGRLQKETKSDTKCQGKARDTPSATTQLCTGRQEEEAALGVPSDASATFAAHPDVRCGRRQAAMCHADEVFCHPEDCHFLQSISSRSSRPS